MARIDALYLEDPCSGSRRIVAYLAREGIPISRDRVRNLMRRMGLRAIYQRPRVNRHAESPHCRHEKVLTGCGGQRPFRGLMVCCLLGADGCCAAVVRCAHRCWSLAGDW
ncbi:IS3 family transposase [Synechococcus sp. RSCCF101]|uniref:IS3 family transposase n=1 Tax=Synechococcus sp. RSCCF101 TaxID=2511069 RepID=UPI001CD9410C|nr:IS3 family transposase [Synechococcus sp. RSCCF101]